MVIKKEELKMLLKEKGVKDPDDFNAFITEIGKEVVDALLVEKNVWVYGYAIPSLPSIGFLS